MTLKLIILLIIIILILVLSILISIKCTLLFNKIGGNKIYGGGLIDGPQIETITNDNLNATENDKIIQTSEDIHHKYEELLAEIAGINSELQLNNDNIRDLYGERDKIHKEFDEIKNASSELTRGYEESKIMYDKKIKEIEDKINSILSDNESKLNKMNELLTEFNKLYAHIKKDNIRKETLYKKILELISTTKLSINLSNIVKQNT
jgi:chromosome segregation ATPase